MEYNHQKKLSQENCCLSILEDVTGLEGEAPFKEYSDAHAAFCISVFLPLSDRVCGMVGKQICVLAMHASRLHLNM